MSKDIKIELNHDGVRALLRSPEMLAVCEGKAREIRARLGDGYGVDSRTGTGRVNAEVRAETPRARRENYRENTILKALRGG